MKTFIALISLAILVSGFSACRNGEPRSDAGTQGFAQPAGSTQSAGEKDTGNRRTTAEGNGMQDYVKGEVIVKFRAGVSRETVERIAREHNLAMVKTVTAPSLYLFRIEGKRRVPEVIAGLRALGEVEYAEPNYTRQTQ